MLINVTEAKKWEFISYDYFKKERFNTSAYHNDDK